ncbi:hypothetical protein SAMN05660649_03591 [Desulfotomaculum arcticum]|uniref:Uncharacterized protein n=1 Tax=Desulfotruncus arcticus DSM 17038 TaxID=1121424 RepID=A0A1I2WQ90_9FIRM|nr:hypothetical protein [Desulfotruncus arcticus]SFH03484.1 hypothetical protein SAMN05660649_03591 [Desulfotomaculum arcticum] [Desulfotruncus arcticus DSM 17038]
MYTLSGQIKWSSTRILYYLSLALMTFTGGLFIYIAAPYSSFVFFNDPAFWKYHKYFPKLIVQLYRLILLWMFDPHYRGMYAQPLTAPPSSGPDPARVKLSAEWKNNQHDCARCINCCIKINCPLLDYEGKKCLVYNSLYWRYFSCGRFPVSQRQIDYYQCPKWEMREDVPGKKPADKKEGLLYT